MKVLHIIDTIARANGGPARSSQGLVNALNNAGIETYLLSCRTGDEPWLMDASHFFAPTTRGLKGLKIFVIDILRKLHPDLIHINGIWRPENHIVIKVAQSFKIPYIVAPRGMLDPWALRQKWWKKIPAWWLYQKKDLEGAIAFHATAKQEEGNIRNKGFLQSIIISPNGVAIPHELPAPSHSIKGIKTALFLSRLHPGKGLMSLVEAWGSVRPQGWQMRVVGFDGYGEKSRVLKRLGELGLMDQWIFEDPMDDGRKWKAFVNADLFIHPSKSENFGISIAEALYAGLPVITTKGAPWQELEERNCGWWIDIGVEPLVNALRAAMSLSDSERREMGQRGRELVLEKYTWDAIGREMAKAYEEVLKKD